MGSSDDMLDDYCRSAFEKGEFILGVPDEVRFVLPHPTLTIERLDPSLPMPKYAKEGDAGFDLYAARECILYPGTTLLIPTGIRVEIPEGYELQIRPRSSMGCQGIIIPNSPGTIDQGYRGEIKVPIHWLRDDTDGKDYEGKDDYLPIVYGQRIAQAVLAPVTRANIVEGEVSTDTERGEDGFGSSGR